MKKFLFACVILLVVILAGAWLVVSVHTKSNYDRMREGLVDTYYVVTPMDDQFRAFLAEVQSNWTCRVNEIGGPDSEVVKLAGMTPSVRNLIYVFNYQVPEYSWFSPKRNRQAALIGLIKAKFFPRSVDKQWHVSEDQHLAVLWGVTNAVYVHQDETGGLRTALYFKKKKNIERSGARTGDSATAPSPLPTSGVNLP